MYSLQRVLGWIGRHWRMYLAFALTFALGIFLLLGLMNMSISMKNTLQKSKELLVGEEAQVSYSVTSEEDTRPIPISPKTVSSLKEKYGDHLDFSYASFINEALFIIGDDSAQEFSAQAFSLEIFFTEQRFFEDQFHQKPESGVIYAGEEAREALKAAWEAYEKDPTKVVFINDAYSVEKDSFVINGRAFPIRILKGNTENGRIPHPGMAATIEDSPLVSQSLFLDIGFLEDFPLDESNYIQSILKISYRDADFEVNLIPQILNDLAREEGKYYNFSVDSRFLEVQKTLDYQSESVQVLLWMSLAIILVVVTGMIGIMLIYLYQRKKSIAISMACGASFKRVAGEIYTEVCFVFLTGALLGIAVTCFSLPTKAGLFADIEFYPITAVAGIVIALCASVLTCFVSLTGIRIKSAAQALKEL